MAVSKTNTAKKTKASAPKKAASKAKPASKATAKVDTKKVAVKKNVASEVNVAKKEASSKVKTSFSDAKNASRFAVIKIGGSQLKVVEGLKYEIKKIDGLKGDKIDVMEVLLTANGDVVKVGKPYVDGAKVTLLIDSQKKGDKLRVFKFKAKARYRKTYGSRELLTRVEVKKIEG